MMTALDTWHAANGATIQQIAPPPDMDKKRIVSKVSIPVGVQNCIKALREKPSLMDGSKQNSNRRLAKREIANGNMYSHKVWGDAKRIIREESK